MENVVKFLNENPNGFLATVEDGRARVRPFQYMLEHDGAIYFCTANTKEVYKQLRKNSEIEYSSMSPQFQWIRISGIAEFENNIEVKEKILAKNELVKSIYKSADNPVFEVFYIKEGKAVIADFSGNPPKQYVL